MAELEYLTGFGNEHATEAVAGVLPIGQNSPQKVAHDLYTEQISGTSFTKPRAHNQRTWMYRARPSVRHITGLRAVAEDGWLRTSPDRGHGGPVAQMRWSPIPVEPGQTWLSGLRTIATNGDAAVQTGGATHMYFATESMDDAVFVNADGELLIAPQEGELLLVTEMGRLHIRPSEIAVVPRGVKFRVEVTSGPARGYVCENYGASFELPEPGPIGTNALALPRDFEYPVASPEADRPTRLVLKHGGRLFETQLPHTPLDVVAWHGNYAPYRYDLRRYCPIGPVLFDHPDPSIWTVLTSPSESAGVANIDFILFRERWNVAEHTFRPPWFHTNVMSELMGLIDGAYDAKKVGFRPGGISLHNAFLPHGPDSPTFEGASEAELAPQKMDPFLAVMFESRYVWTPTEWALGRPELQDDYADHWAGLDRTTDL